MNNKNAIYFISIVFVICLASIFAVAFAYIGRPTEEGNANVNVIIASNNAVTFNYTGDTTMSLIIGATSVDVGTASNTYGNYTLTSEKNTTINMTSNSTAFPKGATCTYDIVYTPTVAYTETPAATSAGLRELTIRGTIGGAFYFETNIAGSNPVILYSSSISTPAAGTATTVKWKFSIRFYNLNIDQSQASGQTPSGVISISNINCTSASLANFLVNTAPKSGTSAVGSTPWILTSDRKGEWRYAGKNPDNYIQFNNELWRIIGVMPNVTYCTGKYGTPEECSTTAAGSLVKIIRNGNAISSSFDYKQNGVGSSNNDNGSNDWSDSQIMLLLNGTNYLKTAYDSSDNALHGSYTITNNVIAGNGYNFYNATYSYLDGNGTTVYRPSAASSTGYTATSGTITKIGKKFIDKIATVKWTLYSINNVLADATGSPAAFYNEERNIDNSGVISYAATLQENRPAYWYGKVGLMYPSDYGYATYGDGNASGTYSRSGCLAKSMYSWTSNYQTYCAYTSWLLYHGITSTPPGTTGLNQWAMSPFAYNTYQSIRIVNSGTLRIDNPTTSYGIRPVVYLKPDTYIRGGTGKWNDPFTI